MEDEVHDAKELDIAPIILQTEQPAGTKIYSNFSIIPLLRYGPSLLQNQFYKPPTTLKKTPALFHAILKFLMDTKPCNGVFAITRAFLQRQTSAYLRQVNYFLVCTRTELPTPSSSDFAFFFYFALI